MHCLALEAWSELNVSREERGGKVFAVKAAKRGLSSQESSGSGKRKRKDRGERERGGSQFRKSISELSFPDCPHLARPAAQTQKKGRRAAAGEFGEDFYFT